MALVPDVARFFQSPRTLLVPLLLRLLSHSREAIVSEERTVLLIHHTVDEADREKLVGTSEERGFLILFAVLAVLVVPVKLIVNKALLALNVAEHVFALGEAHEVREHLRVLLVKLAELWQPHLRLLLLTVEPLEELVDVVQDEVVLENADHVRRLIVD